MDEMTSVFFSADDYRMILEYQKEIEAKNVQTAIMNAVSLAMDYTSESN